MEDGNDYLVHNSLIQNPQESSGHKKSESKKKEKENINSGHSVMNGTEIAKPVASPEQVERLKGEITAQGDKVRNLKLSGAGKVKELHQLSFKNVVFKPSRNLSGNRDDKEGSMSKNLGKDKPIEDL